MVTTESTSISELLFPHITESPQELERRYPPRTLGEDAFVTRFAPSPTGFLHIGGLFTAMISTHLAKQSGGLCYLRIEDTDKKREVEGGISGITESLRDFGIIFDEGVIGTGEERGGYGPYRQSDREAIYHVYAKDLVRRGLAYPCFCTESELEAARASQEAQKLRPGCYKEWAFHRNLTLAEVKERLASGQSYVLRLRSEGSHDRHVTFSDGVKGKVTLSEHDMDIVILKSDGMPTYHFAHVVDDHLMRTTHVIRGDEWLSSAPIHLQLFEMLGLEAPSYSHIAPILKQDGSSKRKLSKRKDPEAAVSYFKELGFPSEAILEYMLGLANWTYEDWRKEHPSEERDQFRLELDKMGSSGALFDRIKLEDISKQVIARMDAAEVYRHVLEWAKTFHPELAGQLETDPDYAHAILAIGRGAANARKDIAIWSDVPAYMAYFYENESPDVAASDVPDSITTEDAVKVIEDYASVYRHTDDKDEWFSSIQQLSERHGYAGNMKQYKKEPAAYKGHVGDVSLLLRLTITGRARTPDLYDVMQVMGNERVMARLRTRKEWT
ncbi:glutamate--tRNA ligase [Paenibacillus mendelii]|uniref:Glutamate--tRNA ligase n=1 Tax=Paenibacillus mendelii TaxID=206163 RepID=A0ABV6J369_9BACL|nr:glutamate--tRNA ligase [Paenibacillus mendelii]MCQ6559420.1 glutamate--tRNA ligase [Paenibacillus mendelii]